MLKLYETLWAILAFAIAAAAVTSYLTDTVILVFGFIVFSLIFMGMISVLPTTLAHPAPKKLKAEPLARNDKVFVHGRRLTTR